MTTNNAAVAVFSSHQAAEAAIRKLAEGGLDLKHFSIVGKGYHTEEKPMGFYNAGDRVRFWGENGAMWGGLWGLLFGGMLMVVPVMVTAIAGLSMAAHAEPISDPHEVVRILGLLMARYPAQENLPGPMPPPEQVRIYRLRPRVISVIDYTKGFGHTDLVTLERADI